MSLLSYLDGLMTKPLLMFSVKHLHCYVFQQPTCCSGKIIGSPHFISFFFWLFFAITESHLATVPNKYCILPTMVDCRFLFKQIIQVQLLLINIFFYSSTKSVLWMYVRLLRAVRLNRNNKNEARKMKTMS